MDLINDHLVFVLRIHGWGSQHYLLFQKMFIFLTTLFVNLKTLRSKSNFILPDRKYLMTHYIYLEADYNRVPPRGPPRCD
jgi:hypothetical protein